MAAALTASCASAALLAAGAPDAFSYTAYVSNWASETVSPINTATNVLGAPIKVGSTPAGIAITPDGKTAYVANFGSESVTPIDTVTGEAGAPIKVGSAPALIAIAPDGKSLYVPDIGSESVTPISTVTDAPGTPIKVGKKPLAVAITPDGKTAYVTNSESNTVTPIDLATDEPGAPIEVGNGPFGIAITPDGKTAYVANFGSESVTPISTANNLAGAPIRVGSEPFGIAITPDGQTVYVTDAAEDTITPIAAATNQAGTPIAVGNAPIGIAITPDGKTAYVANWGDVPFTANTTAGSKTLTGIVSTTRLTPGMTVTGPPHSTVIPEGTTISAVEAGSVTLSQPASETKTGLALVAWGTASVVPLDLATQTAQPPIEAATSPDAEPAITPDQAPVASLTATSAQAQAPSTFDATASTVAAGTISSYAWSFGDGTSETTSGPIVAHVYAQPGSYTATLTETDSAGTSTSQVFTGQTVSRDGGPSARASVTVTVAAAPESVPSASGAVLSSVPGPLAIDPPATPTTRPARPAVAPPVLLSASPVVTTARGDAVVAVSCPVGAPEGCRGSVTIRLAQPAARRWRALAARCARGCRSLGSSQYEARAGQRVNVRVHIASFGRRLLRTRGILHVRLIATSVAGLRASVVARTVTLKARTRSARSAGSSR